MSVPTKRKKADPLHTTKVWLQIYSLVVESLIGTVDDVKLAHQIASNAANAIIKEVQIDE